VSQDETQHETQDETQDARPKERFDFFPAAFQGKQLKPTVILMSSALLCAAWWYFGRAEFYDARLASQFALWGDPGATRAIYMFTTGFLMLGVVPALVVKLVFREKLADYGVQLGNWRGTVLWTLILAPLWLFLAYMGSNNPHAIKLYPLNQSAGGSPDMFALHALTSLMFFAGFEFLFRGYIQFGLRDSVGEINSMLIQMLATVLLTAGKPIPNEAFGAMFAGMVWGFVAYRTRSLASPVLQHLILGLTLDFLICYA
jgi:membrane protease YdiL (CAAX protease family)